MTSEDRIATLEKELAKLRADFSEAIEIIQYLGGQDRAFEAAVLAVIATHPHPELLEPALNENLARTEAGIVHQSQSDAHLQGMQEAQNVLLAALKNALARQHNS